MKRSLSVVYITLILFCGTIVSYTQLPVDRERTYDVLHYTIRVSFDHRKRAVFGDTSIKLKPLNTKFSKVVLDAVGLDFNSVMLESTDIALKYSVSNDSISVELDKQYSPDEVIDIRLKYTATPKKGIYFIDESRKDAAIPHSAQIWTQGQPDEARHWFPAFDFPSDKATTEKFITVEDGYEVIGNGELVSKDKNPNGTNTFHYKMNIPHSTYLVSFIVGKYKKIEEKYRDIPFGYYIYPGTESIVPLAYGNTAKMFEVFEELTGVKYPFNRYDQTIVSGFKFGGMENITATTMADDQIFYARNEILRGAVEDLVSHEVAHSWFGNNVTCKNWAELWLNEGFATFLEAVVREKLNGRWDYIRKIEVDADSFMADEAVTRNRFGLYNTTAGDTSKLFDRAAVVYNKGSAVIHTLRYQVGDDVFWKAINKYLDRHRFGSVETKDLKAVMEEESGQDLRWFFDQWVYKTGYPRLNIRQRYNAAKKELTLTVDQTQRTTGNTPAAFRLPLEIEFNDGNEIRKEKIDISKRTETITFASNKRPTGLKIDPEMNIPLKDVRLR